MCSSMVWEHPRVPFLQENAFIWECPLQPYIHEFPSQKLGGYYANSSSVGRLLIQAKITSHSYASRSMQVWLMIKFCSYFITQPNSVITSFQALYFEIAITLRLYPTQKFNPNGTIKPRKHTKQCLLRGYLTSKLTTKGQLLKSH